MKPSRVMEAALGCVGRGSGELVALARPGRRVPATEEDRRGKATDAAERVFLAHGFHATTMAAIACSAGMSKKTIYQLFASKADLLDAVLMRRFAALTRPPEPADDDGPVETVLCGMLRQIVNFVLSAEELAFARLLIADSIQAEQVIDVLNDRGLFSGRTTLAQWLARQAEIGALHIEEPQAAAEMLVGMVLGEMHIRLLLKTLRPPGDAEVEHRVTRAVAFFLRGARQEKEAVLF